MCIILSNSKRGQTSMLISYTMKKALLCGASLGRGTKVCSQHLGHMNKMATTPIYGKNPSKISPEPAGRFSQNLVCSIRDSSPS